MQIYTKTRETPMALYVINHETIRQAGQILLEGGLVLFPTGCIYALFVRADDPQAVDRLRFVKQRPPEQGVSLVVPPEVLPQFADVGRWSVNMLRHIYQWPVGLLFQALPHTPNTVIVNGNVLNLWHDAYPPLRALWEAAGGVPIAGTSANLRGRPGHYTFAGSWRDLNPYIDLGVSAEEPMTYNNSTTLIDMEATPPRVIRQGAISVTEVQHFILPDVIADPYMTVAKSAP